MSKFSVKKPFTVLVAVIAVLVFGVVSYLEMTPDLLPNMDFPYVVIVTTYPGASPEKVEEEVTKPLEQSMSTLEHIVEVSSTSAENYSMVMLEFEEAVNMDTIGVDIQQSISTLESGWDDMVSTPYVLKINPSMLPVEIAAVSMEGMSTMELTDFLNDTLINKLEGIPGVARITTSGTVVQELHIVLDQEKIDALNKDIAEAINSKLDETADELNEQLEEIKDAQAQLEDAKNQLEEGKTELADKTSQGEAELGYQQSQLIATKAELSDQIVQLTSAKTQLQTTISVLKTLQSGVKELEDQIVGTTGGIEKLRELKQRAQELEALENEFNTEMNSINNDPSLSPEEKLAALDAIKTSPEYLAMQADRAALDAELAAMGLTVDSIDQKIEADLALIESIRNTIDSMFEGTAVEGINAETLDSAIKEMEDNLAQVDYGIYALKDGIKQIDDGMLEIKEAEELLSEEKTKGLLEISSAASELNSNSAMLSAGLTQLESGIESVESARKDALAAADLNSIITADMISSILTAQNFAMPAGYIEQDGITYMVSVGEEIRDYETVSELVLFDMGVEGIEPIYITDVASVLMTDNRNSVYSKLNGEDSITLQFEKQSTYATAEVTNNINERFEELEEEYDGLTFVALMNQGDYIYLIVDSIINSLLLGAVFAVIILFIFLRDWRPTFITLCSIPLSVIFAIVLMYFCGVTINMISLSGLAVAVGMLVDNSVVVIENIYRLRAKGATAVQAAVSGAKQVAGAVTASTLTTVCVFLPIVFVKGLTKQLFTDLALTLTFSLMASLIVSLTLVPAMAAGMLKKQRMRKHSFMGKSLEVYGKLVGWSLKYKAVILGVSVVLLLVTGFFTVARGFEFMPEMDMPNVNVTVAMPEDADMEKAVALADEVLARIDTIEGIETVGASMSSSDSSSLLGGGAS
ncbi:MAG: efflux RND transporter permease subunit, partial [Clostridia bacterium]|nr:efflux RND transporter permease subunit [Clostridia bacterium]